MPLAGSPCPNYNPSEMKLIACNPVFSRFLVFGLCLALPIFFVLKNTFASEAYLSEGQRLEAGEGYLGEKSSNFSSEKAMAGSLAALSCRTRYVYLQPYDEDGDGEPDTGMFELNASSLVDTLPGGCRRGLILSVNRAGDAPDMMAGSLLLSCSDVGAAELEVHAWCQGAIIASCLTEVYVTEQFWRWCEPLVGVCGLFFKVNHEVVDEVQVFISGDTTASISTGDRGGFCFYGLEEGHIYTVTPFKDTDAAEGVSLFDMVLINKHILGIQMLNSPYLLIAADVNNSRSVTALDILALHRLLLGIDSSFSNNSSWRFVARDYVFPDPRNPWLEDFPEQKAVTAGIQWEPGALFGEEFIAVKVGDVNP